MTFSVRRLAPGDDRASFRSGNVDLDRFFSRYAGQHQFRHHIGTSYVAVDGAGVIAGYATVAVSELAPQALRGKGSKLPSYPLPVLRLARLAVDERFKGRGAGALLLSAVFELAAQVSAEAGCVGVVVDAKPEAIAFYQKLGFEPLELVAGELGDRPLPTAMFLSLDEWKRAGGSR